MNRRPTILYVDPEPDLGLFLSRDGKPEREPIDVLCQLSPERTLQYLDDRAVDAVVCGYDLPGGDGMGLLQAVRDAHPDVPFFLYTARGPSDLPERAVTAGATAHYWQTSDPKARKDVRKAVYRAAVSFMTGVDGLLTHREATQLVGVTADVFAVHDFETGRDVVSGGIDLLGADGTTKDWSLNEVFERIHPGDRDRVLSRNEALLSGVPWAFETLDRSVGTFLESVRLRHEDGSYVHCQLRGAVRFADGEAAKLLISLADVTEEVQREWSVEAGRLVISTPNSEAAAEAVVGRLLDHTDCEAAWVARTEPGLSNGTLRVLASDTVGRVEAPPPGEWVAGDVTDRLLRSVSTVTAPGECGATDTEGQHDVGLSTGPYNGKGADEVSAVPISDRGVLYGVLCVARSAPGTDLFERLLRSLAETLAYRQRIEHQELALSPSSVTKLGFTVGGGHFLADLSTAPSLKGETLVAEELGRDPAGHLRYWVSVRESEATGADLSRALNNSDAVAGDSFSAPIENGTTVVSVETSSIAELIEGVGGVVVDLSATGGRLRVTAEVSSKVPIRQVSDLIASRWSVGTTSVRRERARTLLEMLSFDDLTEKQARAIKTATRAGFFARPQEATAEDVADLLGVARSTALHHIRTAEERLFSGVFES
jgi:CheY-like chemotaxis protein